MDETPIPILARESEGFILNQFLAQYDVPAYVRRALRVQEIYEQLLLRCRRQREDWLRQPRAHLGVLQAHAGGWSKLLPFLQDEEQLAVVQQLAQVLEPRLRIRIEPTTAARVLRRDLRAVHESLTRFNRRWLDYLHGLDLTGINAERENYNRYYLVEKECAMRSARMAREGFRRLEPVTCAELEQVLAPLPVLQLKEP